MILKTGSQESHAHPQMESLGAMNAAEEEKTSKALMDLRGIIYGMTVVKSLTVTYGRRLGHQDQSLVFFEGSPYPEDLKPFPSKINNMEIVRLPYGGSTSICSQLLA